MNLVSGELKQIAASESEFEKATEDEDNAQEWFMKDLLEMLREKGINLKEGECYGYILPPVLSGKLEPDNIEPTDHRIHQSLLAQIHQQSKDLPPGTRISGFSDGTK